MAPGSEPRVVEQQILGLIEGWAYLTLANWVRAPRLLPSGFEKFEKSSKAWLSGMAGYAGFTCSIWKNGRLVIW